MPAGLLVDVGGVVVDALLAAGVVPAGAVVLDVPLPFGEPVAGVPVGAAGGNETSGVGSGGNGFEVTVAINSFMP